MGHKDPYFYMTPMPAQNDPHFFFKTEGGERHLYFMCFECGKEHLYTGLWWKFCDACGKPHPVIWYRENLR